MLNLFYTYWPRLILSLLFASFSAILIKSKYQGRAYFLKIIASFLFSCTFVSIITEVIMRSLYDYAIKPFLPALWVESGAFFALFYIVTDIASYILPIYIFSKFVGETYLVGTIFYIQFVLMDRATQLLSINTWSYLIVFLGVVLMLRLVHRNDLSYIYQNKDTANWKPMFYYNITLFLILDACFAAMFIFPEISNDRLSASSLWLDCIVILASLAAMGFIRMNVRVEKEHDKKLAYMRKFQDNQTDIIRDFATISEAKSGETGQHIRRVSEYVAILAKRIIKDDTLISYVKVASMMHDIGKLMIPNEIIEKPGKLTAEEYEKIKEHSAYGESLLSRSQGEIMIMAQVIAHQHHERWDGTGYPCGLKGDQISLYAQIVSVADVYDALTSKRSYKDPWPPEEAKAEIIKQRGHQFSPAIVDSFIDGYSEIEEIRKKYAD